MATTKLSQSKPEPKAKYDFGLTDSQLNILGYIADATDGLDKALASEQDDGVRKNDDLHVFSGMARGINCAVVGLFNAIIDQKQEERAVLKEAGHPVPIAPDRKIHLTREQAETLRDFWYAVSELASSNLVNPEDGTGEVTTLTVVLRSVDNIFGEVIDRQLNQLEGDAS